jgi:hypothetical protein
LIHQSHKYANHDRTREVKQHELTKTKNWLCCFFL